jgi:hypothetical protein
MQALVIGIFFVKKNKNAEPSFLGLFQEPKLDSPKENQVQNGLLDHLTISM